MTITEFILSDLKTRIAAGEPPAKLTLAALSRHYDVSATPVRRAIDALIAERIIIKGTNGRLACSEKAGSSETSCHETNGASDHPLRKQPTPPANAVQGRDHSENNTPRLTRYEENITAEIVRLSLCGEAQFLREQVAAARFGAGRSVIRRVFSKLAGRGLIEHVPRRGWRIRPYREADMHQYLDVRESLELRALHLAWDKLDADEMNSLLKANSQQDGSLAVDNRLHDVWINASGNRYIADFFDRHGAYFNALFDLAAMSQAVVKKVAAEHRGILRAILAGDKRLAKKRLARHIRGQRPKVGRMFQAMRDANARRSA